MDKNAVQPTESSKYKQHEQKVQTNYFREIHIFLHSRRSGKKNLSDFVLNMSHCIMVDIKIIRNIQRREIMQMAFHIITFVFSFYETKSCSNDSLMYNIGLLVIFPSLSDKLKTSHRCYLPTTMRVNSKPFFTDFRCTWFGKFANPTYPGVSGFVNCPC